MGIVNGYVDADLAAGKLGSNAHVSGGVVKEAIQSFTVAAADEAGSVYRVFKALSPDIIITEISIWNDALTGVTDVDVGAYGVLDYDGVGAAISANCFADAQDIHAGNPISSAPLDGLSAVSIANREVPAWQLYGDTQYPAKHPAFDLCLTFNTMTTGASGNVAVRMRYTQL